MKTFRNLCISAVATSPALWAGTAAAHTGHGHDELGTADGLLHALSEPDHLAMLVVGGVVCTLLAPRVLRAMRRATAALRARRAARTVLERTPR